MRGADGVSRRRFTLDGNTFDLEDRGGNITVKGHWQDFGKCGECPAKAEVALQAALAKVSGKLTEQTEIIPATTQSYGPAGAIVYQPMKLMDLLQNLSKTYNSLLDKAKVPEALWKPQDELSPEDKNFFVRDGTGVISGALDQTIEEVTDLPQLVGLGLSVVSDPQGAYDQLSTFAQNMSWQKAKDFATEAAKSTIQFDNLTSPKSEYQRYGTGRIGVTVVKLATTGGAATFLLLVKKTPDLLALWTRLIKKMQDLNWSDADIARFKYDFQTTEDILKRFDADEFDFDASKAFDENKILRRNADNLTALTNIKSLLPADGSMTMDDIKAALTKSDSKQSTLTDLEGYLKNGNLDEARKLVDKGVSYASALPKPLPYTEIGLIHNTAIDNFVTQRQAARQAIQDLTSTGDAYKTARQAKISEIIGYSEQIAESVADASFIKDGFERVDELLAEALPGSGKSGKFDRLYRNPQTGEWKVVECKGGTSQPGGRRRKADGTNNEQGTEDYIRSIIEDLTAPGSTITASQRDLLGQLQSAIDGGKAQSYLLRQPFDDATGELKQARLSTIF